MEYSLVESRYTLFQLKGSDRLGGPVEHLPGHVCRCLRCGGNYGLRMKIMTCWQGQLISPAMFNFTFCPECYLFHVAAIHLLPASVLMKL